MKIYSSVPDTPTASIFETPCIYIYILIYLILHISFITNGILPIIETRIPLFILLSIEKKEFFEKNLLFLSSNVYLKNGIKIVDISLNTLNLC